MADYTPVHTAGAIPFTSQASATITGGQVLIPTGNNTVGPAGAAATNAVGVAAQDAVTGQKFSVWPLPGVTHEVTAAGAVTAGANVVTAAAGQVNTAVNAADTSIGTAVAGAASSALLRFIGR